MNINYRNNDDLSELYSVLEDIENDGEDIMCPPFRNYFYSVDDMKEYNRQMGIYIEYKKKKKRDKIGE